MGLFLQKKNEHSVYAPVSGKVIDQKKIPDEAFAQGLLGKGVGIVPSEGKIYSPVDGTLVDVSSTRHAYSILSEDGAEILIHIGIDTVEMKGEGFEVRAKAGDVLKVGDVLGSFEPGLIKSRGYSDIVVVIITNNSELSNIITYPGECTAQKTEIIKYLGKK